MGFIVIAEKREDVRPGQTEVFCVGPFLLQEHALNYAKHFDETNPTHVSSPVKLHSLQDANGETPDHFDDHMSDAMWAAFGLAIGQCQQLELALLMTRQVAGMLNGKSPLQGDDFWEFMSDKRHGTMGKRLRDLRATVDLPEELIDELQVALALRNDLAHHYFMGKRGVALADQETYERYLKEFVQHGETIRASRKRLNEFLDGLAAKHGHVQSPEFLRANLPVMLREAGVDPTTSIAHDRID